MAVGMWFAIGILASTAVAAEAETGGTWAVLSFGARGVHPGHVGALCNRMAVTLKRTGRVNVLPRLKANQALISYGLHREFPHTRTKDAVRAARFLKADVAICGTVEKRGDGYRLTTVIVDAVKGEVIRTARTDYSGTWGQFMATGLMRNLRQLLVPAPRAVAPTPAAPVKAPAPARVQPQPAEPAPAPPVKAPEPVQPAPQPAEPAPTPAPAGDEAERPAPDRVQQAPPLEIRPEERAEDAPRRFAAGIGMDVQALRDMAAGVRARCEPRLTAHFLRVKKRDMTESGGLNGSAYRHYRVSSSRWFVSGDFLFSERYQVSPMLGLADLRLHVSEGETREFDYAFLAGLSAEALLIEIPDRALSVVASLAYLTFEVDDDSIAHVRKSAGGSYRSWQDLSVDWTEWQLSARAVLDIDENTRLHTGIRYVDISAEEHGHSQGNAGSGELDADDSVGLFAALECDLPRNLRTRVQVNFIDETAVHLALGLQF